jgi:ABC-type thiamine transport system ATPase subunit
MPQLASNVTLSASRWSRGSIWRRWDLHVHTPSSVLGDSFSGVSWQEYTDALELAAKTAEIAVIGVTDYMSIEGYERLVNERRDNARLASVDLLIPNIEFRILPQTSDGKALNLHLLIDPSLPDHIDRIQRALRNLRFKYGSETYGCARDELVRFGKAYDPQLADDNAAYRTGVAQFKPDWTVISEWLATEGWLRENSLIGVSNGKDGISGLPANSFGATRDEILSACDFVLSGQPNDRKHYLGQKPRFPPSEIKRQYGSLKPCVHGSDAHSLEVLFKPAEQRYCWIKGDPTFQGLRQILWEPAERIYTGMVPPQASDRSQVVDKITFSNTRGWFGHDSLDLNPSLVAIIGEKGAGKTALADLIAFAAGVPVDHSSQSSFVVKGAAHLSDAQVTLTWAGGEETSGRLTKSPYSTSRPRVRYLSQDFVERLCSADHGGAELQVAIEEVVFSRLDELQKEEYSSFSELRRSREAASSTRREDLRGDLASLHKELERLQARLADRNNKVSARDDAASQIVELGKQLPDATKSADASVLNEIESQQMILKELEQEISSFARRRRQVVSALEDYASLKRQVESDIRSIAEQITAVQDAGLSAIQLQPTWDRSVEQNIQAYLIRSDEKVSQLKGTDADVPAARTLFAVQQKLAKLREQVAADEVTRKRLLDLQKQISERRSTVERLQAEINNLDTKVTAEVKTKKERQLTLYLEVFEIFRSDEATLRELYSPLQDAIQNFGDEMRFSVSVGYRIDSKKWLSRSARFFDGRRVGSEAKRTELETLVEEQLAPAWKSGDSEMIRTAFSKFVEAVDPETFPSTFGTPTLSQVELYDWMYSVDHINLTYRIEYSGVELEHLSPGTRGIALLVLYLLMDEDDRRPLIIDQPEGNLDNSSVFKQLVPYIREAKLRRQIILVTHNPNLVVATDAEQVVVASAGRYVNQQYPQITYSAGSLEHTGLSGDMIGTREAVCLLLEGGTEAFRVRENRYSLSSA